MIANWLIIGFVHTVLYETSKSNFILILFQPNSGTNAASKKKADIGSMFANQKKKSPEKKEPAKSDKTEEKDSSSSASNKSKTNVRER